MDNDFRTSLYSMLETEDETERESQLDELVNRYETAVSERDDLQTQADSLKADLETSQKSETVYKSRLDKLLGAQPSKEEDSEETETINIWKEVE